MGLVSNLAQPFIEPVYRHRLDEFFDTMIFSCHVGVAKPQTAIYKRALESMQLRAEETMFIGDSVINDYEEPINVGMQAILIRKERSYAATSSIESIDELAWLDLRLKTKKVIYPNKKIIVNNTRSVLKHIEILPEEQSGRYNITATGVLASGNSSNHIYIKRFATHNTAPVEKLAYDVYELMGLSCCHAKVISGKDPILITSAVSGSHWQDEDIASLAYEFGKHAAMAYIIAYADFRPRNTLVQSRHGKRFLQVIDLEHCFFSLALDTFGLSDVMNPETFNRLDASTFEQIKKKHVLSPKHMRRAVHSFLPATGFSGQNTDDYQEGWLHTYQTARRNLSELRDMLLSRIAQKPALVIGTRGYRRAMAVLDVDEITMRIHEDPVGILKLTI